MDKSKIRVKEKFSDEELEFLFDSVLIHKNEIYKILEQWKERPGMKDVCENLKKELELLDKLAHKIEQMRADIRSIARCYEVFEIDRKTRNAEEETNE